MPAARRRSSSTCVLSPPPPPASIAYQRLFQDYGIESAMREDMYRLVSAVYKAHQQKPLDKSPEAVRLLEKSNLDYERNGLGLAPAERERFKEIKKELSLLSIDFSKRLNEENGGIWFTPDELRGVPADVVSGLKKGEAENDGKVFLTFKYPGFSAPPDPPLPCSN